MSTTTRRFIVMQAPVYCPYCGEVHIDEERNGQRWDRRGHTTHRCQSCGSDFDVFVSGMRPLSLGEMIHEAMASAKARQEVQS